MSEMKAIIAFVTVSPYRGWALHIWRRAETVEYTSWSESAQSIEEHQVLHSKSRFNISHLPRKDIYQSRYTARLWARQRARASGYQCCSQYDCLESLRPVLRMQCCSAPAKQAIKPSQELPKRCDARPTMKTLGFLLWVSFDSSSSSLTSALVCTLGAIKVFACSRSWSLSPALEAISFKILWCMFSSRLNHVSTDAG